MSRICSHSEVTTSGRVVSAIKNVLSWFDSAGIQWDEDECHRLWRVRYAGAYREQ